MKAPKIHTRNGYPIVESMSGTSILNLATIESRIAEKRENNASAIRRVHHN